MKHLIVGLCLLAATACFEINPGAPGPIDQQVTLDRGEQVTVGGVRLHFEGVTGDSRCPLDALCIHGGDAVVKIAVTPSRGGRITFELHTGDMKPITHRDLTVALVQLAPYPFSARPIDPNEYRVTLRVTR